MSRTSTAPDDRLYSADHERVAIASSAEIPTEPVRIDISQLAAERLGELVYVELADVGSEVTAGRPCGEVESTKSVSELVSPVSGVVTALNDSVVDDPGVVTTDPFGAGWLFTVQIDSFGALMTADEYAAENGLSS